MRRVMALSTPLGGCASGHALVPSASAPGEQPPPPPSHSHPCTNIVGDIIGGYAGRSKGRFELHGCLL